MPTLSSPAYPCRAYQSFLLALRYALCKGSCGWNGLWLGCAASYPRWVPSTDPPSDKLLTETREAVAGAYAAVRGYEHTQSYATVSLDELLNSQVERIEGKKPNGRPNALERVKQTAQKLRSAVAAVAPYPPEALASGDGTNTAP